MSAFVRNAARKPRTLGSRLALAVALATFATTASLALETPALAAKKDKKEDEGGKPSFSKQFVETYKPIEEMSKAATPDIAALKAKFPELLAAAETPDDKNAAGGLIYNVGISAKDVSLQRQGMAMMLDTGRVPADRLGTFYFTAGQLAFQDKDWAASRDYYQKAIEAGYDKGAASINIAESYFGAEDYTTGLSYLRQLIDAQTAAGKQVDESWIKRGFAIAYNNQLAKEASDYILLYATMYPSKDIWNDALAVQRNLFDYDDDVLLDLMRLTNLTGNMRTERDYADYLNAANPRRLPGEALKILNQGLAANKADLSDTFFAEVKSQASSQVDAARADLPSLEKSATAANGRAIDAMAAGDMFLNFDQGAKAAEMYKIALTKPGVDAERMTMRLGEAQVAAGDYAAAVDTFGKIGGVRKPVAALWALYAKQHMDGGAGAAAQ